MVRLTAAKRSGATCCPSAVVRKHDGRNFYPKTNNHNFFVCKKFFFTIRYVKQGHSLVEKKPTTPV